MFKMKLGLIGAGYWGKNLVREFDKIGFLHTICEINEKLIADYQKTYPHLTYVTEWKDLLNNPEIISVCISLPAEMHYKFAKEALLAGKDVYVEKPITLNITEATELVKLAEDQKKILMVGHLLQYHSAIQRIKEIIQSGEIGKIKNIVANRLNLGIFRTVENVLWSFAPHDISVILSLCENKLPTWVKCNGHSVITEGVHDITNSILMFEEENIYVNINVNWLNPFKEQKIIVIAEKGMIVFDDGEKENKLKMYKNYIKWNEKITPEPTVNQIKEEIIKLDLSKSPLLSECEHFMNCCLNRLDPITNGLEGVRVLKVLESLTSSLNKNGQRIDLKDEPVKYFSHETAIIDKGAMIGENSKIWHFSHICGNAVVGIGCNIGQNVFIASDAKIGNHCKVQNNVSIYAGVVAENYVFFGPSCVLTNDKNPRTMHPKNGQYVKTYIETGVTLGANCTVVCGVRIGKHALIGAGAVVTKDVEPYSIMVGNPARKIGVIDELGNRRYEK